MTQPRVISVNVGTARTYAWAGRSVTSAIWKEPIVGRVALHGVNLDGDDQADRRVHGGPDKAVYAYGVEDYRWWEDRNGTTLEPGTFGENLTTEGLDLTACVIGQRWRIGTAVLEVAQPREPCFKLAMRMDDPTFVEQFRRSGRFGAYLRIVSEGSIGAGDPIDLDSTPTHGLTVGDLGALDGDAPSDLLTRIAGSTDVPGSWRARAQRQLGRRASS